MSKRFDEFGHNRIFSPTSLRRFLMSFFGITFLVILLVLGSSVVLFTYQTEEQGWRNRQGEAALNATQTVAAFIEHTEESLYLLDVLGRDLLTTKPELLRRELDLNDALNEIVYLDARGQVLANVYQDHPLLANLFTIPQSKWYQEAHAGNHYQSNLQFTSNDEPYIILAIPGTDSSVMAARLKMGVLWDTVNGIRVGETGRVYVVNQDGQLVTHSDRNLLLKPLDIQNRPELRAMFASPNNRWFGTYTDLVGASVVGASARVPGTDWVVVVEMTSDEALAATRRIIFTIGSGILIFSVLLTILVRRTLQRVLFNPVERLRDGANRIGMGDLRYQIPVTTLDEIGQVTEAFNRMAQRLQERSAQLAAKAHALQQSEAQLRRITDNMYDVITEIDVEGKICYASPSHLWVLGTEASSVLGDPIWKRLNPDDAPEAVRALSAVLNGPNASRSVTVRYQHAQGHYLWMECLGNVVTNDQGEITGLILSSRDATARRQVEEKVQHQNQYLSALHETALSLLNRLNSENILEDIVERAAQIVGTADGYIYLAGATPETIIVKVGIGIYARYIGYQMHLGEGLAGRVWQTSEPLVVDDYDTWEGRSSSFPKNEFHATLGVPLKSGTRVIGVLGLSYSSPDKKFQDSDMPLIVGFAQLASIALDNSQLYTAAEQELQERKRTEIALRDSEMRYRLIAENATDMIWMRDMDLNLTYISPAVEKLRGYTVEEAMSQSLNEIVTSESFVAAILFFANILTEVETATPEKLRNESRTLESELVRKDGTTVWAEMHMRFMLDEQDKPCGIIGVTHDISERKRTEEALRQARDELERRVQERTAELAEANIKLENQIVERQRLVDRQTLLYETLRAVSRYLDINQVCQAAAQTIAEATNWSHVDIALLDGEKNRWTVRGTSGKLAAGLGANHPVDCGVIGRALRTGQMQIVPDVSVDSDYVLEAPIPLQSEVTVPFQRGNNLLGTLNVESDQPNAFDADDVMLIQLLGETVALGIDNARLYEAAQKEIAERKQAEQALREGEEKYRLHFENVSDVIYSLDSEFRIVTISPAVEKILGYSPAELTGKPFIELNLLAPASFEQAIADTIHVLQGNPIKSEYAFIAKDGTTKFGEIFATPIYAGNKVVGLTSVARDITERKHAEEALLIKDRAIESSINAVGLTDLTGKLTYANPSFLKLWGYDDVRDVLGKSVDEFTQSREKAYEVVKCLQENSSWLGELTAKKKDGKLFEAQMSASMIVDDAGEPMQMMASFIDITERKRAEEALQANEEKFRSITEQMTDVVFTTDSQGTITYISPASEPLFGFKPDEMEGRHFVEFLGEDEIQKAIAHFRATIEHAIPTKNLELKMKRENGFLFEGELSATVYHTNETTGTLGVIRDVTERKQAAVALATSQARLQHLLTTSPTIIYSSEAKGNFATTYVSENIVSQLGYTPDEFTRESDFWFKHIHPEDQARILSGLTPLFETGEHVHEYRFALPNGSYCWMRDALHLVRNAEGKPVEIVGSWTDITETKQAEQALRESERRFRDTLENVLLIAVSLDTQGGIVFCNDFLLTLTGWQREEVIGKNWFDLFIPNGQHSEIKQMFESTLLAGILPTHRENTIITRNGDERLIVWNNITLHDLQGRVIGSTSIGEDVTERKRTEALLLKFKLGIERSADAIFITNQQGMIEYANPAFEKIYGYLPEEAVGQTPRILKSGKMSAQGYQQFWETLLNKEIVAGEIINKTKDGRLVTIEASNNPILDAEGKIIGFLGVHRDITERKRVEQIIQLRLSLTEFASTHSLEELLQKTLDEVGQLTNSPIGFFHFVETDQKTLSLQAWSTRTLEEFCKAEGRGLHYSIDQAGVWTDCVREKRPVIHNNYQSLPHRKGLPEGHAQVTRELVVPIMRKDRIVAILGIGNKSQDYTGEDVELVSYVADIAWEIAERKQSEQRLANLTNCLLNFGPNPSENINSLVKLVGEELSAACALYNRLEDGLLCSIGLWNTPPDYNPVDKPDGHICTDLIKSEGNRICIIRDLPNTPYAQSDPNVTRYGLKTYVGRAVTFEGKSVGSLCVLYLEDCAPNHAELALLEIAASAIAVEEKRTQAEEALRESEERFRLFMRQFPGLAYIKDSSLRVLFANQGFKDYLDVEPSTILGKTNREIFPAEFANQITTDDEQVLKSESNEVIEEKFGGRTWSTIKFVIPQTNRSPLLGGFTLDVTERKQAEAALRESEERYALAARGANDGLFDWDLDRELVYYSPRWKEMVGCAEQEIGNYPSEWFERVHPEDLSHFKAELDGHLNGYTALFECEYRIMHADGHYRWMLCRGLAVRDANNRPVRMAGSQTDISRRKSAEERLVHDALHEPLTGLPNRVLFLDRVGQALKSTKRDSNFLSAVLFLDLDRFKNINDSLGHHIGDLLLIEVARRLETCVRPMDTIARFGGDEFAILLYGIKESSDAIQITERIQNEIALPILIDGHDLRLSASIGVALTQNIADRSPYHQPEEMLRDADAAMYRAKALGKARYEIFDTPLHTHAVKLLKLEADLRHALENQELRVYYQPIVAASDGHITSVEALVRWQHPEHGLIPPSDFIPIAEESGLIVPMGEWVLRTACSQLTTWRRAGFTDLQIAVNFSARQFQDANLATLIENVMRDLHLPGKALELEITESTAMRDIEQTIRTLNVLDQLGIQISIDDFGNSYSALGYLKRFPFRILKIDQAFLRDILQDTSNAAITTAIIAMARTLNLRVIAEGVETPEQLEFLRSHDCDEMQGYLFSRPVPTETMTQLLLEMSTMNTFTRSITKSRKNGKTHR